MDLWLILLRCMGAPASNFALVGRWVGHIFRGKLTQDAISKAPAIPGELALEWCAHYVTGVAFAILLQVHENLPQLPGISGVRVRVTVAVGNPSARTM
jgi:hypothetical protein